MSLALSVVGCEASNAVPTAQKKKIHLGRDLLDETRLFVTAVSRLYLAIGFGLSFEVHLHAILESLIAWHQV